MVYSLLVDDTWRAMQSEKDAGPADARTKVDEHLAAVGAQVGGSTSPGRRGKPDPATWGWTPSPDADTPPGLS